MKAANNLVVTTKIDKDVPSFINRATIAFLEDYDNYKDEIFSKKFDTIYFRSQFSSVDTMPQNFKKAINKIGSVFQQSYFIDHTKNLSEILDFEDKWRQYERFGEFMPRTWKINGDVTTDRVIYKKRLSSKTRGISFDPADIINSDEWLAQEMVDIQQELRVYTIRDHVYPVGAIKSSKHNRDAQVLIHDKRQLSRVEVGFISKIIKKCPEMDLLGLDIALTKEGPILIEVNRSPLFQKILNLGESDMAELLYKALVD